MPRDLCQSTATANLKISNSHECRSQKLVSGPARIKHWSELAEKGVTFGTQFFRSDRGTAERWNRVGLDDGVTDIQTSTILRDYLAKFPFDSIAGNFLLHD